MGIFLALSLISAGFLVNCQSQPASPAGQQTDGQSPAPESSADPVEASAESPEQASPASPPLRLLTKKILDRAYNRDHLDVKKFQYFISETMEMERGRNSSTLSYNAKGELLQEDRLTHEKIVIEKGAMGVAVGIRIDKDYEHWEIDVRFEPANDKTLTFIENEEGTGFDLFYVQTSTGSKIPYGTEEYSLSFAEIPRLLIKLTETENTESVVTKAEGIAVDSGSASPRRDP
jgi:hypothetical protein